MAEKEFKVCRSCEVVSDADHLTEAKILEVVNREDVVKWAYILHDKDVKEDGTPKNPHYHVYLKFKDSRQVKYIAQWFGLAENFIHRIRSNERNALSYLCHHTDTATDKYQYDPCEVKASFDYPAFLLGADDRAAKASEKVGYLSPEFLQDLGNKLDSGEVAEYNLDEYIPDNYTRAKNAVILQNMIKNANDKRAKKMRNAVQFKVIWLFGGSNTGKSHYAAKYAEGRNEAAYFSANSSDFLGEYKGQPIVVLDDLRGCDMRFSELLKLLDPNVQTAQKSRYKDKYLLCHTLFITSPEPPETMYDWDNIKKGEGSKLNAMNQLMRRIDTVIEFKKDDMIESAIIASAYGNTEKYDRVEILHRNVNPYAAALYFMNNPNAAKELWLRKKFEETHDPMYADALRGLCGGSVCDEELGDDEELPL